jgi:hypothetical protein
MAAAEAAEQCGAVIVLGDARARDISHLMLLRYKEAFTSPRQFFDVPRMFRSLTYLTRMWEAVKEASSKEPSGVSTRGVGLREVWNALDLV